MNIKGALDAFNNWGVVISRHGRVFPAHDAVALAPVSLTVFAEEIFIIGRGCIGRLSVSARSNSVSTIDTTATVVTAPAVFGDGGHDRFQTVGVPTLVANLTNDHL